MQTPLAASTVYRQMPQNHLLAWVIPERILTGNNDTPNSEEPVAGPACEGPVGLHMQANRTSRLRVVEAHPQFVAHPVLVAFDMPRMVEHVSVEVACYYLTGLTYCRHHRI